MILDRVNKCLLQQEKKQVKSHAGGQERVCIIAIARVCYRGNLSVISVCVSTSAKDGIELACSKNS